MATTTYGPHSSVRGQARGKKTTRVAGGKNAGKKAGGNSPSASPKTKRTP